MKCKDCEFFKITQNPMKPYEFGEAVCKKHNLITNFSCESKFEWLECIEEMESENADT